MDVLPPGYLEQKRVQRYPIGLAVMARHHTEACVDGSRQGYRSVRAELSAYLSSGEIDAVLAVYRTEGAQGTLRRVAEAIASKAMRARPIRPARSTAAEASKA